MAYGSLGQSNFWPLLKCETVYMLIPGAQPPPAVSQMQNLYDHWTQQKPCILLINVQSFSRDNCLCFVIAPSCCYPRQPPPRCRHSKGCHHWHCVGSVSFFVVLIYFFGFRNTPLLICTWYSLDQMTSGGSHSTWSSQAGLGAVS